MGSFAELPGLLIAVGVDIEIWRSTGAIAASPGLVCSRVCSDPIPGLKGDCPDAVPSVRK